MSSTRSLSLVLPVLTPPWLLVYVRLCGHPQRAPSSLNMQSYVCVVVREQEDRDRLAEAMLHSNAQKVKDAPVVVVIAADTGKLMLPLPSLCND